ncbi:hypothetical protein [Prevotella intermedia]|uniref:Uncharacterized protein n=1 Tax=Prevotella intermedia TaxID=28131 RepID=A0A2D3LHT4_PREIN|nr:hypothetical protein [Prevotella intermedia]ATV30124.1 hypothetical protein CTM46_00830 [Prevotella intermedia]PJI22073.1 hypothetical protein CTM45_01400 [Prevotella intermedia]
MKKTIIFEGKVTLADKLVDFRIYKNEEEEEGKNILIYYSFETNPEMRDKGQMGFHRGQTLRAKTLEDLLFQFSTTYQKQFTKIVEARINPNF